MKKCIKTTIAGSVVTLSQSAPDNFTVSYGMQIKEGLTYAEAALEYGACVMHALACTGRLDNRDEGEE